MFQARRRLRRQSRRHRRAKGHHEVFFFFNLNWLETIARGVLHAAAREATLLSSEVKTTCALLFEHISPESPERHAEKIHPYTCMLWTRCWGDETDDYECECDLQLGLGLGRCGTSLLVERDVAVGIAFAEEDDFDGEIVPVGVSQIKSAQRSSEAKTYLYRLEKGLGRVSKALNWSWSLPPSALRTRCVAAFLSSTTNRSFMLVLVPHCC